MAIKHIRDLEIKRNRWTIRSESHEDAAAAARGFGGYECDPPLRFASSADDDGDGRLFNAKETAKVFVGKFKLIDLHSEKDIPHLSACKYTNRFWIRKTQMPGATPFAIDIFTMAKSGLNARMEIEKSQLPLWRAKINFYMQTSLANRIGPTKNVLLESTFNLRTNFLYLVFPRPKKKNWQSYIDCSTGSSSGRVGWLRVGRFPPPNCV